MSAERSSLAAEDMRSATARLTEEFSDAFSADTVESLLRASYEALAVNSDPQSLPTRAERFARQRLSALARADGLRNDARPTVLFLCVHNAGRSQMARGFFTYLAGDRAIAWSGGSEPGSRINPAASAAMAERGVDISAEFPKPLTNEVVRAADVVVTMGCGDACPYFPGTRYEDWALDDAAGKTIDEIRPIRDEIERRVRGLLDELGVPAGH